MWLGFATGSLKYKSWAVGPITSHKEVKLPKEE